MPPLPSDMRNQLASVVKAARRAGEAGAAAALDTLAVGDREAHSTLTDAERSLRIRLRAHGRQLGDLRDAVRGTQPITRLTYEVAYEHWHRMLFARFLAENQLLIEPQSGVAITMTECEDLARETGADAWALAGQFGQQLLPAIFRPDDPALDVALAPEVQQRLEELLQALPADVFTSDDAALGWTYQYWQAEKKDAVNASGVKIGAEELPAVTQLFTEHYMVQFLFHNTIGAWHAGKVLAERPELAASATSEEELRQAVRLSAAGGYDFPYLRFVREPQDGDPEDAPSGPWRPAAGPFVDWPTTARELTVLDPCCGSGHFLVEGFALLVRLRMAEEDLPLEAAIAAVLTENLHGLEIDPRCTQIAAFNLALAAWRLTGRPIDLPPLGIACSGLAVGTPKAEWVALAGNDERLRTGMERLYALFQQAPELGSLIDPTALGGDFFAADFAALRPLLTKAFAREAGDAEGAERAVAAQGMAQAAELLATPHTLAITNVPYLGRRKHSDALSQFANEHYSTAKSDLATMLVERMLNWMESGGTAAAVTPQNWLFLTSHKKLREELLRRRRFDLVARLGPKAFQTPMWDFNVMLLILSAATKANEHCFAGVDVSEGRQAADKSRLLRGGPSTGSVDNSPSDPLLVSQSTQLDNPGARITFGRGGHGELLARKAVSHKGLVTGDIARFGRMFWEIAQNGSRWSFQQSSTSTSLEFSGRSHVVLWDKGAGELLQSIKSRLGDSLAGFWIRGGDAWGNDGIVVTATGRLRCTLYTGEIFDNNISVLIPRKHTDLPAIWSYLRSPQFHDDVRQFNQQLKIGDQSFVEVPFDAAYWGRAAADAYPCALPEPQSDDPTQWLFHGHPAQAEAGTDLQVAVARLLCYGWPPERDPDMRLADEARAWVARSGELDDHADSDGIVCLHAIPGERPAADRLRRLLAAAFGADWSAARERALLSAAAGDKKPAASLEVWLRDKFFEEHCKLFHHRPFVWQIWDGQRNGFSALVNAHKLTGPDGEGRRTLEALTYSYLGDWIDRQHAAQREGTEGADARLAARDAGAFRSCGLAAAAQHPREHHYCRITQPRRIDRARPQPCIDCRARGRSPSANVADAGRCTPGAHGPPGRALDEDQH